MPTFRVDAPDGRYWTIDAPEGVTEAEAIEFAQENADSWENGARYRMVADEPAPAPKAAPKKATTERNAQVDAAVESLDEQIKETTAAIEQLGTRQFAGPTPTLLGGTGRDEVGPATGMAPVANKADIVRRRAELVKELESLNAQRDKLVLGTTGQTVGGIGGALAGGGAGALLGSPLGPPGIAAGALIGSILGAAGGVAAGTHLWDIPEARNARDISDEEAAQIIKDRMVESLVWDGAFVLIVGPGGRLLGKMVDGAKFVPALKAVAKEAVAWDQVVSAKGKQLDKVIEKRAAKVPQGTTGEVSRALGVPTGMTPDEEAKKLVETVAKRSGGRVPTTGEVVGVVEGTESFARTQAPRTFMKSDQILANAAEDIRKGALSELDKLGAATGVDLGESLQIVRKSAETAMKRTTRPVFEAASKAGTFVDMRDALKYLDDVLVRDERAAGRLLQGDRAMLESIRDALRAHPAMPMDGALDFISGNRATLRGMTSAGVKPAEFTQKVLAELNETTDTAFLKELQKADPKVRTELVKARNLYRDTMEDLYSDTMGTLALKNPEDVGRALRSTGTVTEIRDVRAALDRALNVAPGRPQYKYGAQSELSKAGVVSERARIDAGMVKGFLEANTVSIEDLSQKLKRGDFRDTLKELLVGPGAANPKLGMKLLEELDNMVATVKLIKPEKAPQPGRITPPGVGGLGAGTVAGAATGQGISPITVGGVISVITGARFLGKAMATAMTSGNAGVFRTIQRAASLAPATGKNAAAMEAFMGVMRELDAWDKETGGEGIPDIPPSAVLGARG